MNMTKSSLRNLLVGFASAIAIAAAAPALAQTGAPQSFAIEAQSLGSAVNALSRQSGVVIIAPSQLVEGRTAPALSGTMTTREALSRLLRGTGLEAVQDASGAFVVRQRVASGRSAPAPQRSEAAAEERAGLTSDTIVVIGSNIRGAAPSSSPLYVYDRADLEQSGASSTEQFMRTLPQNFSGGSTEFSPGGLPGDFHSTQNNTLGTGANLRGLGSRGTLVLVNGNRLAPSSSIGDFVDLSLIPLSALERVEVLTDGASSLYGGDAVAGVVNFVLRKDFDGAETELRYGSVTSGDMEEVRFSQTLGTTWASGGVLAIYEYMDRESLQIFDRPSIAPPALANGQSLLDTGLFSSLPRFDLLPSQERHSAVLSARQEIGSFVELTGTALYSRRSARSETVLAGATVSTVTNDPSSEVLALSFGADVRLSGGWQASIETTLSDLQNENYTTQTRVTPPASFAGGTSTTDSSLWSVDVSANGPLFSLPGGDVRAAFGGHFREEDFQLVSGAAGRLRAADRRVSALYGELLIPLVGAQNAITGVEELELHLSGRWDDYSDFGSTTNPKIGLMWSPVEGLQLRSSYSTSFAPPSLGFTGDLNRAANVFPYSYIVTAMGSALPDPSLDVDMMFVVGAGADLQPETSRAFTAGFDYTARLPRGDFTVGATYYDIDFEDRLGQTPMPGNVNYYLAPNIAFADPASFPAGAVILSPSAAEVQALAAGLNQINYIFGATLDNVGIINQVNAIRNLASVRTRGFDVNLGYSIDGEFGTWDFGLNANYIADFEQQAASTTPRVDTLNTYLNPVDLQLRGRVGFSRDRLSANLFVNYVDAYRTDSTANANRIKSWTTADLTFSYAIPAGEDWMSGSAFTLTVSNLFDRDPPRSPTSGYFLIPGYDPANASPVGRFASIALRKRF